MGEIEDLKRELAKQEAQEEVRGSFRERNLERKQLKRKIFSLRNRKKIAFLRGTGRTLRTTGKFVTKAGKATGEAAIRGAKKLEAFEKRERAAQKKARKGTKLKPKKQLMPFDIP